MKKSFRTLALGFVTVGMLAACNQTPAAPNWTSAQIKDMKDNLYGYVLPYLAGGLSVEVKDGFVTISGGEVKDGDLEKLAAKFTEKAGWEDLTVYPEAEGDEPAADPDYYEFEKAFDVKDLGQRFVNVQFGAVEAEADPEADPADPVDPSYEWLIQAGDPYVYEFPGEEIAAAIQSSLGSSVSLPDPVASRYYFYYEVNEEEKTFGMQLNAYMSAEAAAGYGAKLTAAGFGTPKQEIDSDGDTYYSSSSPDDSYAANFAYSEDGGYLAVWPGNFKGWPSNSVAAYLAANQWTDAMPAYPFSNIGSSFNFPIDHTTDASGFYEGYDYEVQFVVTSGNGAQAANNFVSYLKEECNFTSNGSSFLSSPVLASPNKQFMARFMSQANYVFVDFGPYVEAITTWARVEALYSPLHTAEGATTLLPEFSGSAIFSVTPMQASDEEKAQGYVSYCDITIETELDDALATYGAALVAAGFVKGAYNTNYYDPAGKFYIRVSLLEEGSESFTLRIVYDADSCDFAFPEAELKERCKAAGADFDAMELPTISYAGVSWFFYQYINQLLGSVGSADGAAQLVTDLTAAFTAIGWTVDPDYPGYLNSADGTFYVYIGVFSGTYVRVSFGFNQ